MDREYTLVNGKKLRCGFTTGSAATAGAKAAAEFLIKDNYSENIRITLPDGQNYVIDIESMEKDSISATAKIIKDAGDDPDITNGIEILVRVQKIKKNTIRIKGGKGVGRVTKKGLPIQAGNPAINPTPLKMIRANLEEYILNRDFGLEVEVIVPKGEEIAKSTLNGKLGIVGGISILGTTGIVKPMSEEAFKKSLDIELDMMLKERRITEITFTFGNFGRRYAIERLGMDERDILITSNFMGHMLESAAHRDITSIKLIGNIGKAIKVAGGIFHTHSRMADSRMEILTANALLCGEKRENLIKIMSSNTTEEAIGYIENKEVFSFIAEKIKEKCESHIRRCGRELGVEVLVFSNTIGELGRSDGFD